MAKTSHPPLPKVSRALEDLGGNIKLARLRRRLSAALLAERLGVSRPTLRAVERGDPKVSVGTYAAALLSLGLLDDLSAVGSDDVLGRKLRDAELGEPKRAPRRPRRD